MATISKGNIYETQTSDATGRINNPVVQVTYKGKETETTRTIVDNTAKLISVEVKSGIITNILRGYYYYGNFYADASHTIELEKSLYKIYIDIPTNEIYLWGGQTVGYIKLVKDATDQIKGIMKLYKVAGTNEDGTMTQKAIVEVIDSKISGTVMDGGEVSR